MTGEFDAIARLASHLPSAPAGEVWIGDDAAVLDLPVPRVAERTSKVVQTRDIRLLFAVDAVVAGVHADLSLTTVEDLGWKAVSANVSDVAAMGGWPGHAVVSVAGGSEIDLDVLYTGIEAAAAEYECPVVGGDLVSAQGLVVSVAVTGYVEGAGVVRSGARPGDQLWVTGPLGGSAAGLRFLRAGAGVRQVSAETAAARVRDHARPRAKLAAGQAAKRAGATAMIDVSDGFAADLFHIADASKVGFALIDLPVAGGATESEALGGGEDYELIFSAPAGAEVEETFAAAGLPAPSLVGRCDADQEVRTLRGRPIDATGWQHDW